MIELFFIAQVEATEVIEWMKHLKGHPTQALLGVIVLVLLRMQWNTHKLVLERIKRDTERDEGRKADNET